ncbi:MAG: hypothetical protein ACR2RE_07470, partial [Geminicoccaceae bacterium]
DHDAIVLVGQAWPPLEDIERLGAAVAFSKGKRIITMAEYLAQHPNTRLDEYGFVDTPGGPWHPDPFVREEVEILISDAYDQAVGRLRAVNSQTPKKVVIVRPTVPGGFQDFVKADGVDELVDASTMEIYLRKCKASGFLGLTPMAGQAIAPDLFRTANAFKTARRRHSANGGTFPYNSQVRGLCPHWESFVWRVNWRFSGRGSARQTAIATGEPTAGDLIAMFGRDVIDLQCRRIDRAEPPGVEVANPKQDATAVLPTADELTVITSKSGTRPTVKRFRKHSAGVSLVTTKKPYLISAERRRVSDLPALYELLAELQHDPYSAIIRGETLPGTNTDRFRRLYRGKEPTLRDVPRKWAMLDIDDFALPFGVEIHDQDDIPTAVRTLLRALPEPFRGAACVAQLSNSMGLTADPSVVKVHLWFRLKHAVTGTQLKESLRIVQESSPDGPAFDMSLANAAQLHATGNPECQGFDDPLAKRLFMAGFENGRSEVDLPVPKIQPRVTPRYDEIEASLSDRFFEQELKNIGGENGFHRAIGQAAK